MAHINSPRIVLALALLIGVAAESPAAFLYIDKPRPVKAEDDDKRPSEEFGLAIELTKVESGTAKKEKAIDVHWKITYSGKRWPLIVLRPSLEDATDRQTALIIKAQGKSGKWFRMSIESQDDPFGYGVAYDEDWFLEVPKTKPTATGVIQVEMKLVRDLLIAADPKEFSKDKPPPLEIQLHFKPRTRGDFADLDAWNGDLKTKPMKFEAKDW